MLPQVHIAVSVSVSIIIYGLFQSAWAACSNLLVGVILDLDHVLEYYRTRGFTLNPLNVYRFCGFAAPKEWPRQIFFWLHAYEYFLVLVVVTCVVNYHPAAVGALVGMGHHLVLDQMGNNVGPFSYFLTYRLINRFRCDRILTEKRPWDRRR